ncbi:MAG: 5'-nucleotidase [Sulfuricurvum sp.]|uniref:5'-nucleotidase n=1 Tax=Sulfuricurvum sp. TaxID=2025608 RepID=UPI00271A5B7F|nr:5'-nucleotidase [Sulfuricurvum sp.]MDO9055090.1 5'-nucleotidase [Sulfuricurvum sp.]
MALDLSDTLVVGITATALFDLSEEDRVFKIQYENDPDSAIEIYRQYMSERENIPLKVGTGFPLVKALLELNRYRKTGDTPLVEVVIMSRNSPETGLRVLHTIREMNLPISRSAFTAGETVVDYLDAFDVDLFLTTDVADAQQVIDSRTCAAAVVKAPPKQMGSIPEGQVRIAFDGDAVLFDESSELLYKQHGIEAFHAAEDAAQNTPLGEGPYATLLKKLSRLQDRLPIRVEYSPIRIAIVTARNSPAEMRVIKTLREWGVYVDEAFFLGGVEKSRVLKAFKPHIFFDDQDVHLDSASHDVPSGKVPYYSDSLLNTQ